MFVVIQRELLDRIMYSYIPSRISKCISCIWYTKIQGEIGIFKFQKTHVVNIKHRIFQVPLCSWLGKRNIIYSTCDICWLDCYLSEDFLWLFAKQLLSIMFIWNTYVVQKFSVFFLVFNEILQKINSYAINDVYCINNIKYKQSYFYVLFSWNMKNIWFMKTWNNSIRKVFIIQKYIW